MGDGNDAAYHVRSEIQRRSPMLFGQREGDALLLGIQNQGRRVAPAARGGIPVPTRIPVSERTSQKLDELLTQGVAAGAPPRRTPQARGAQDRGGSVGSGGRRGRGPRLLRERGPARRRLPQWLSPRPAPPPPRGPPEGGAPRTRPPPAASPPRSRPP